MTSAGAPPPPSLRMVKHYDEAEARAGVAAAEREIRNSAERRQHWGRQRQQLLRAGLAFAIVGGAALLLYKRQRSRGGGAVAVE